MDSMRLAEKALGVCEYDHAQCGAYIFLGRVYGFQKVYKRAYDLKKLRNRTEELLRTLHTGSV